MKKDWALDQTQMPLLEAILKYNNKRPAYFCIPGHRYEQGINPQWREIAGDSIFQFDLTETPYTDDLHNAQGVIKAAQELACEIFSAQETHFLVNGTTCGNQAMVISAASQGQKIAIPRNAHKSVLMGLIISGAEPVYMMPEISEQTGLHGGITPETVEKMFREHPDCKSVLIVSPTYHGICSELAAIAKICHAHDAVLLVDEAHGAHCYFSDMLPAGALAQGADMCAQSLHKVTGALTQSSMLHINSCRIDRVRVNQNLHLVQSTSPSYLLMTSLDAARQDLALHGGEMAAHAVQLALDAERRINTLRGISCMNKAVIGQDGIFDLDVTRLTVSAAELGLTGFELKELLFEEYGCDTELADYKNVLAIVTFANTETDVMRLVDALDDIAKRYAGGSRLDREIIMPPIADYAMSPREAYFAQTEEVAWKSAVGRVAAEMIAPYPPGIPVIYPGERMSQEVWDFIDQYRREHGHFHGPGDPELKTFKAVVV